MAAIQAIAAAAGQCENDPNDRPVGVTEREADKRPHAGTQDHRASHLTEPEGLPGQGYREQQREDQVGGQQGLDERQLEVAYRPGGEHLAQHHAHTSPGLPKTDRRPRIVRVVAAMPTRRPR